MHYNKLCIILIALNVHKHIHLQETISVGTKAKQN